MFNSLCDIINLMNNKIFSEVSSVKSVLEIPNLVIPDYQRPYVWNVENVEQLLSDVFESFISGKQKYRIGSVILYNSDEGNTPEIQIVDGQQRITTILLILNLLYSDNEKPSYVLTLLKNLKFNHISSEKFIRQNKDYISKWINKNLLTVNIKYREYLETNCEFLKVEVNNQSEAFQMFDSQNGRGKELEAYNLLKAYHIRAMRLDSPESKILCDKRWEAAALYKIKSDEPSFDVLYQLFAWNLYSIRLLSRKETFKYFTKKEIKEFKGITLNKNSSIDFPWQNKELLNFITNKFYENFLSDTLNIKSRFISGDPENINLFVLITQEIINGKPFFDYVETYTEMYKRLFLQKDNYQLKEFKDFYRRACEYYDIGLQNRGKSYIRKGDTLLRKQYESLIMLIFDRFGEVGVNEYYYQIYKWVYAVRLEQRSIQESTVFIKQFSNINPFEIIRNAHSLSELNKIQRNIDDELFAANLRLKDKFELRKIWDSKEYRVNENEI